nr:alpha-tectorin [Ciona intestinalis]|eukprot:XP_002130847.1 alpha-tectorin [Ciona intestinalis]
MNWLLFSLITVLFYAVQGETAGSAISNAPELPSTAISCGSSGVNITIANSYLAMNNITNVTTVILVNETSQNEASTACTGVTTGDGFVIRLSSGFDMCAKSVNKTENKTCVTYLVRLIVARPTTLISRVRSYVFNLKCEYNTDLSGNIRSIIPVIRTHNTVVKEKIQDFSVDMSLFTDYNFTTKLPPSNRSVVIPGVYIYVGIWLKTFQMSNTILQAHQCWATPNRDPKSNPMYHIISDNCPRTDPLDPSNGIRVKSNYVGIHVEFAFKAFRWVDMPLNRQRIFVHCFMSVCDPDIEGNCNVTGCATSGRRRRSTEMEKSTSKVITMGPINVETYSIQKAALKKSSDSGITADDLKINGLVKEPKIERFDSSQLIKAYCEKMECEYKCQMNRAGQLMCICPNNFYVDNDGKACVRSKYFSYRFPNLARHGEFLQSYSHSNILVLAFAVCFIVLLLKFINRNYI